MFPISLDSGMGVAALILVPLIVGFCWTAGCILAAKVVK